MNRILVLGGTGFIGHHIVKELLNRNYKVNVLARPGGDRSLLHELDVNIISGDLTNSADIIQSLEGCDGLIHAAAHYPKYSIQTEWDMDHARQQILNIHEAIVKHPVERFVYVSSFSAVGRYPDGRPEDEDAPWPEHRNKSTYARVKRAMQDLVLYSADRYNSLAVAPTGVYGPGDRKPATGELIVRIAKGRLPVTLRGKTNSVSVFNVAEGTVNALEKGKIGRVYVLGDQNETIREFCNRVAALAMVDPPHFALPADMLHPIAWLGEQFAWHAGDRKPPLPLVGIDFARFSEFVSSDVAKKEIDYDPSRHPLNDTIQQTLDWFKQHGMI